MDRVYNFSAGPSMMPLEALTTAAQEMTNYSGSGMSVMEMSHRSKIYIEIFDETVGLIRELMNVPEDYSILLLQGGATAQFSAVPMNLMTGSGRADYIDSGSFAHTALVEAQKYGAARAVKSSRDDGYTHVPTWQEGDFDPEADYVYITTNNTIFGTRFIELPKTKAPLVADMSSNILAENYDVRDFGVIYAGAQKNVGPAGLTIVIVKKELLGREMPMTPRIMSWKLMADNDSMLNTPATYSIYMAGLCMKWLKSMGGVSGIEVINREKAGWLYEVIDESALYKGVARTPYRSFMNVTFTTGSKELDDEFCKGAQLAGMTNLKGHRSAGGMRASIYNAMPQEGVKRLAEYMRDFEMKHR